MFLIGGPAFSGTTLLTLLLNQGKLVCLDEPDFHNPRQSHRGIPVLQAKFPAAEFPEPPTQALTYKDAVCVIRDCETALGDRNLGIKTNDYTFIQYARIYKELGFPVIANVRDIRDALVRPLPEWVTEADLNRYYRLIWRNRGMYDIWVRYEKLVTHPEDVMAKLSRTLSCHCTALHEWDPAQVNVPMIKLDRHELLKCGRLSRERVGIWKHSGKQFSRETHDTARLMGY